VGEDLAAQRPFAAAASGGGARLEYGGEFVLLPVRGLELPRELGLELLAVRGEDLDEASVGADSLR
jgi:hypothetical protein